MRKSELGNLVAANMADIIESEEHRSLFNKQAEVAASSLEEDKEEDKKGNAKEDSAASDDKKSCKCDKECVCKDGECKCKQECKCDTKTAKVQFLLKGLMKISEAMDSLGLDDSASNIIRVADLMLDEASYADDDDDGEQSIDEMLEGLDLGSAEPEESSAFLDEPLSDTTFEDLFGDEEDLPEVKRFPMGHSMYGGSDEYTKKLLNRNFWEDGQAETENISNEMSNISPDEWENIEGLGKEESELDEELRGYLEDMEEIKAANADIDMWLKKNSSDDVNLNISELLSTAEKDVEDYLLENKIK
jgi:hypothetical protein